MNLYGYMQKFISSCCSFEIFYIVFVALQLLELHHVIEIDLKYEDLGTLYELSWVNSTIHHHTKMLSLISLVISKIKMDK